MSKLRALARFALPAATLAVVLAACGKQELDPELSATLIQPVARVEILAVTIEPGSRTGEEIYTNTCKSCHDAGLLDAPKYGDAGDWAERLEMGHDGLTASAIAGKGAMPPRGGVSDLTDDEVARAVAYMANSVGAGYVEPPIVE